MADVVVEGKILRWGNSFGIRIRKDDLEARDLHPGQEVLVRIEPATTRIDLADLPTFHSGLDDVSERHDAYLAEGLMGVLGLPREARDDIDDGDEEA